VPPAAMVAVGAATAAGGSLLGALAPSTAPALLGMAIAGLGTSVCAPTIIALAGRTSAHAQGAATGTVITIAYLGFVVGPAAVGLLSGATTLATALVGVAMLAALLVVAGPAATRTAERV
jgi:MFS family permease